MKSEHQENEYRPSHPSSLPPARHARHTIQQHREATPTLPLTYDSISSNSHPVQTVFSSPPGHEITSLDWLADLPPLGQRPLFDPSQLILQQPPPHNSHHPHHHQLLQGHQVHQNHQVPHQPHMAHYGIDDPSLKRHQSPGQINQSLGSNQPHIHSHNHNQSRGQGRGLNQNNHTQSQNQDQQLGQVGCVSSASCPWVLSPVPNPDGWSLQQCADLGCVPEVPDVEQCMPPQSPSQSSADAFPPPVPIDFTTTTTSSSPSMQQNFDSPPSAIPIPAQQQTPRVPASRKRRSSPAPTEDHKPAAATKNKTTRPTKVAHSVVEQRYRDNLNGKIAQLHKTLSTTKGSGSSSSDEGDGEAILPRTRKADVLASAIDYIKRAEKSRQTLEGEVDFLKTRITMLEKLVKCEDCNILTQMNQMRLQAGFAI